MAEKGVEEQVLAMERLPSISFYFRYKLYINPQNIPCAPQLPEEPVFRTRLIFLFQLFQNLVCTHPAGQ